MSCRGTGNAVQEVQLAVTIHSRRSAQSWHRRPACWFRAHQMVSENFDRHDACRPDGETPALPEASAARFHTVSRGGLTLTPITTPRSTAGPGAPPLGFTPG